METPLGFRKRRKRYEDPGCGRYLTFSCFHGQPFLKSERTCLWLLDTIRFAKTRWPFDLWAWVIMPNHVHLLIHPCAGASVGGILRAMKESLSKKAVAWVRKHAPEFLPRMLEVQPSGRATARFWQAGGGYDRNIFSGEELREKIVYIHNNPVRRGLVASPGDWRWPSYAAWNGGTDEPLALDRATFPSIAM